MSKSRNLSHDEGAGAPRGPGLMLLRRFLTRRNHPISSPWRLAELQVAHVYSVPATARWRRCLVWPASRPKAASWPGLDPDLVLRLRSPLQPGPVSSSWAPKRMAQVTLAPFLGFEKRTMRCWSTAEHTRQSSQLAKRIQASLRLVTGVCGTRF